jgi:lysophospholipase L1-like esterase
VILRHRLQQFGLRRREKQPQQGSWVHQHPIRFYQALAAVVMLAFAVFGVAHGVPRAHADWPGSSRQITPASSAIGEASDEAGQLDSTAIGGCASRRDCDDWVGTWATALTPASLNDTGRSLSGFQNESIRQIVQVSVGGDHLRIRLSNAYGQNDLVIGHASVAKPLAPSTPDLAQTSIRELSFRGRRSVTVPIGQDVLSDPIPMAVAPLSQLAVTIYLAQATGPTSWHWFARQTAFVYDGDHTTEPGGGWYTGTLEHFFFLAGVEVPRSPRADGAVVVLGNSISDGYGATPDANTRWPDFLAGRLVEERHPSRDFGVLNVGLSGSALNHDGDEVGGGFPEIGPRALARLDDHVFAHPGVRTVIVELGINDIFRNNEPPEQLIAGLRQLTYVLRRRGLRVLLATLIPGAGSPTWSPEKEMTREAVNAYIRNTRDAHGVVDIDAAVRDPLNPTLLNPLFIGIDFVHPNDEGNRAIAAVVPLQLL